jgi:uroporphyrinogen decarboxylase
MEDLISYVKVDAKHSYEDESTPVVEAKRRYGDRIAILGGVDVDKLARSKVEDVEKYTFETLKKCALGGGYALGSGNTIANYVRVENYLAMLRIGEKYGVYTQTA